MRTARMSLMKTCAMVIAFLGVLLSLSAMAADHNLNRQLFDAARAGDVKQAKSLLSKGAEVNAKAKWQPTALMSAAGGGNLEVVKFLVDKGADMNTKNESGKTALDLASANNRLDVAQYLKAHGAK